MALEFEGGDGDLSFDLLFSGSPEAKVSSYGENTEEVLAQDFRLAHSGDDGDGSPQMPFFSTSAPQSGASAASARRRTRSRKRTTTLSKNEKDAATEKEKLSVFVYGCHGKKPNWKAVLEVVDAKVAQPREYYHKEGSGFGFIQFQSVEASAKAAECLNNIEIESTLLGAERCSRASPFRENADSPLVKNSILVIKNLPYNMKEEKLLHILNTFDEQPEDVSFHHDSSGTFRGMAFVKYSSIQDSSFVFEHISSIDVGGRPIKVEYKRKPDPADEDHQKIQQQLQHFKENEGLSDLAFPFSLSNSQRKQIHVIAEKLGLRYQSLGENENRFVVVSKKKEEEGGKSNSVPKRKLQPNSSSGSWNDRSNSIGQQKFGSSWSDKSTLSSFENSPKYRARSLSVKAGKSPKKPESSPGPFFIPKREPRGPDGSQGFSAQYRLSRQKK